MSTPLINREVSWLDFNQRVLELADEPGIPLLERLKFIAICSSNLDEFFQVRVAALKDQVAAGMVTPSADGMTPAAQLAEIGREVAEFVARQEAVLLDRVVPALQEHDVHIVPMSALTPAETRWLSQEFQQRIFPVLTPLAVDPAHPFPYISNLALNLAATVTDPETGERRFARVKVPNVFPRLIEIRGRRKGRRFVLAEDVISAHLHTLFAGMVIEEKAVFRVTRNADLTLEDEEADDLLAAVEMELRKRRFGGAVRLEVQESISEELLELLIRELNVEPADVYTMRGPVDLTGMFQLASIDDPELRDEPWLPLTASRHPSASFPGS